MAVLAVRDAGRHRTRPRPHPDAVLCRTNIGAMREALNHLAAGCRVALAGGGNSLRSLATTARDLQEGHRTWHPELILIPTWGELQDYADFDPAGRDLKPFVDLIDQHGADTSSPPSTNSHPRTPRRSPSPPPTAPKAASGTP